MNRILHIESKVYERIISVDDVDIDISNNPIKIHG